MNILNIQSIVTNFAATASEVCGNNNFFGFPKWYKYLEIQTPTVDKVKVCSPTITGLNDVWLVGFAVIEILLRISVLIAIAFIIVGGVKFITARGNPDKILAARTGIQDALIGMVIAIAATAVVSYIAGRF